MVFLIGAIVGLVVPVAAEVPAVRQITHDPKNHSLDNNDNFSPDDRFLVYDTRENEGAIQNSISIEKVEIATGKIDMIYRAPDAVKDRGPGVGAVSFHPVEDRVIFIHGPFTSTGLVYDQACRFGAMVPASGKVAMQPADARDVTSPFTPGALRGGTHRHEFSGNGEWIGFTYNDAIMKARGVDLRTIGVTRLGTPVTPDAATDSAPGNHDGAGFSVLVVHVVPEPQPGSDEISRAAEDSWVGAQGYVKPDGSRQHARAFIGDTRDAQGRLLREVYLVDIPSVLTQPGPLGPLAGTLDAFPAPPAGAAQRRLTHTEHRPHPGCFGIVRADPQGRWIAFLANDDAGARQIFLVSPLGGEMIQFSSIPGGVRFAPRWLPSGKAVVTVSEDHHLVAVCTVPGEHFGKSVSLYDGGEAAPYALVVSHDGKTIAFNRDIPQAGVAYRQIFVLPYEEGEYGIPIAD